MQNNKRLLFKIYGMKKILLLLLILFSINALAQPKITRSSAANTVMDVRGGHILNMLVPVYDDTTQANIVYNIGIDSCYAMIATRNTNSYWYRACNPKRWVQMLNPGDNFNGNRPITRDFTTITGVNLGTTGLPFTMEALLFPSQVPTSALTATYSASTATGFDLEVMSAGAALPVTLNWTGGRQASTATLATINVAGANQTFAQPSAPGSVSGTKAVTVTRNTNTSFSNVVTTTDSKTATSSVVFNFYPRRYWGVSSTIPPTNSVIILATGGSSEFTTSKTKGSFVITVAGSNQYVYYAYPSSYGALSSIIISGLESIGAFTFTTVSVTNASGFVQNYLVYTSNNTFNNTTISFNSVN